MLREAVAAPARKLCIDYCEHDESFVTSRLIPLPKLPDEIRPVRLCNVLRRFVSKCVMKVAKPDDMKAAGNLQVCVSQQAEAEACIHAMSKIFREITVRLCCSLTSQMSSTHSTENPYCITQISHVQSF